MEVGQIGASKKPIEKKRMEMSPLRRAQFEKEKAEGQKEG